MGVAEQISQGAINTLLLHVLLVFFLKIKHSWGGVKPYVPLLETPVAERTHMRAGADDPSVLSTAVGPARFACVPSGSELRSCKYIF